MAHVLALDEGTTSARAIVFDHDGRVRSVAQREFRQLFPQPGWVEHDPEEIWYAQSAVAAEALHRGGVSAREVVALGITNQRETTVVWDRATGAPIHNAIVWQDRRTAAECDRLRADGCEPLIRERTGLCLDPYFSAPKIAWILDHVPGARAKADAGALAFGTVDTWLLGKLTGGRAHATDATNASRTLLFNIHTQRWDDELLRLFRIPAGILPEVRSSSEVLGNVALPGPLQGIAIGGMAGDQQSALFGQMCVEPGLAKNTYGTGCFLLQNTGEKPIGSRNDLLTTVAWRIGDRTHYALEGSVFVGGAVIQWLRDGLGIVRTAADINALAATVPDNGGVYLVPAFAGLGAPHWNPYARGMCIGITRGTTRAHLARAALEGIAFQVADLLDAVRADTGRALPELRVDGGAARSDLLMQIQADLLGVPIRRPQVNETTALGAGYLAGLAVGFWRDVNELAAHWSAERTFEPGMSRDQAQAKLARWRQAVERAKDWEAGDEKL